MYYRMYVHITSYSAVVNREVVSQTILQHFGPAIVALYHVKLTPRLSFHVTYIIFTWPALELFPSTELFRMLAKQTLALKVCLI